MTDSMVQINVPELVRFFDEKPRDSKKHATAIVSVCGEDLGCGLLTHYFEGRGACVQVRPEPCTSGKQRGARLDRWVRVMGACELSAVDVLLQVEVKNWSAHAIGGRELPIDAQPEEVADYKRERWAKEWSDKGIIQAALRKVTERMRPPHGLACLPVEPLACMWTALHPTGDVQPLFSVPLPEAQSKDFNRVWFFSMSSYLRGFTQDHIEVEMPATTSRMHWLNRLFRS